MEYMGIKKLKKSKDDMKLLIVGVTEYIGSVISNLVLQVGGNNYDLNQN